MIHTDKTFIVYMHISPCGKRYVGITCQKPEHRWGKNGNAYTRPTKKGLITYFGKAVLKYGWENIEHEILHSGLCRKDANALERYYIFSLDLMNVEKGYNQAKGGDNHSIGEEGRKNLSKAHLGQKAWNKGIPMSESSKRKSSTSHKKNPTRVWLGKKFSESHKEALREAWKKRKEKGLGGWSDEQREKFIEAIKENGGVWNKGKKLSEKHKNNLRKAKERRKNAIS